MYTITHISVYIKYSLYWQYHKELEEQMEGKHTFLYSVIVVLRGTCSGKKKGEGDPSTP